MNRRIMLLVIGSLLLTLGCGGDDPAGPASTFDPLVIGTVSLPNAAPAVAYSVTLAATGGDGSYTWSVFSGMLPLGLSLTAGAIAGTPNAVSIRSFAVQVTSGDGQSTTQALTITVAGPPFCSSQPASAIPTFEDAILEAAIRAKLSVGAQDDLTCGLVSGLTVLDADSIGIISLAGVENLTNLTRLNLAGRKFRQQKLIIDISPLSGLTSLTFLTLFNNNVSDISSLSGLTGLTFLDLGQNSLTDISPLSGLTSLTVLDLRFNSITDLSPLSGLTSLTDLDLEGNSLTDISPLTGLTSLRVLGLGRNLNVSDIGPLLNNTGLGVGDNVDLRGTSVSCGDVAALEAKGVVVQEGRYSNNGFDLTPNCL